MKIILIRHGDPDYVKDFLTEKGEREAKCLAERIKVLDADVREYYCSPLGRAKETCRVCLEPLGRQATVLPWIEEYRGRTIDEDTGNQRIAWDYLPKNWMDDPLMYDYENWLKSPRFINSNCEESYMRIANGFDALIEQYGYHLMPEKDGKRPYMGRLYQTKWEGRKNDDTIVIFCHMIATMCIVARVTGIAPPLMMHGFYSTPTGVTILQTEERVEGQAAFRVRCMGDMSHLLSGGEPISDSGFFPM